MSDLCDHVPDEPPRLTSYSLISGSLDVDWTRVFLDAVGREADVEFPPACHEARRTTAACPPWQETVLETLPNFIELIHRSAAELRKAYRLRPDDAVTVVIPRWKRDQLTDFDRALILEGHVYVEWVNHWSETSWRG